MRLFRQGKKKFGFVPAVFVIMLFTAGVSWFLGYQNRDGILGQLVSGLAGENEESVSETDVGQNPSENVSGTNLAESHNILSESHTIPVISEPVVTESQIAEARETEDVPAIRVLIHTSDYNNLLHDEIIITSPNSFFLSWAGGEELYAANSTVTIEPNDIRLEQGSITFRGEGGFVLSNVHRECGYPTYPGNMEICLDDGKLALVNEVDLESYLRLVVPGEMLTSYGVEALKVQAVCARSYAWCQMQTFAYKEYTAHVDDSVNYQVYNNQASSADSDQAVADTYGQVLEYDDRVVETYYFSTSCGHTTDMEIWQADPDEYPYYPAAAVAAGREPLDLTDEDTFRSFIDWYQDSFDTGFDFYRWEIELSLDEIKESIEGYLAYHGMASVGEITDLQVTSRGGGGIIRELTITGTEGKSVLERQGNVREALGNSNMIICLEDGSEVTGWSTVPSAFFYLEEIYEDGEMSGYILHGGGYGHGVGMSQNGVYSMVQEGYTYDQILTYFYPGTSVMTVFS